MTPQNHIGSEVINSEVDTSANWGKEMRDAKIWSRKAQNALAQELEAEKKKSPEKKSRQVQRGDTLGAIFKGLTGKLDWNAVVEYRDTKKNNRKSPLIKANLIYPGEYVWMEGNKIIVSGKEKIVTPAAIISIPSQTVVPVLPKKVTPSPPKTVAPILPKTTPPKTAAPISPPLSTIPSPTKVNFDKWTDINYENLPSGVTTHLSTLKDTFSSISMNTKELWNTIEEKGDDFFLNGTEGDTFNINEMFKVLGVKSSWKNLSPDKQKAIADFFEALKTEQSSEIAQHLSHRATEINKHSWVGKLSGGTLTNALEQGGFIGGISVLTSGLYGLERTAELLPSLIGINIKPDGGSWIQHPALLDMIGINLRPGQSWVKIPGLARLVMPSTYQKISNNFSAVYREKGLASATFDSLAILSEMIFLGGAVNALKTTKILSKVGTKTIGVTKSVKTGVGKIFTNLKNSKFIKNTSNIGMKIIKTPTKLIGNGLKKGWEGIKNLFKSPFDKRIAKLKKATTQTTHDIRKQRSKISKLEKKYSTQLQKNAEKAGSIGTKLNAAKESLKIMKQTRSKLLKAQWNLSKSYTVKDIISKTKTGTIETLDINVLRGMFDKGSKALSKDITNTNLQTAIETIQKQLRKIDTNVPKKRWWQKTPKTPATAPKGKNFFRKTWEKWRKPKTPAEKLANLRKKLTDVQTKSDDLGTIKWYHPIKKLRLKLLNRTKTKLEKQITPLLPKKPTLKDLKKGDIISTVSRKGNKVEQEILKIDKNKIKYKVTVTVNGVAKRPRTLIRPHQDIINILKRKETSVIKTST